MMDLAARSGSDAEGGNGGDRRVTGKNSSLGSVMLFVSWQK